jgi:hypothetical protein
MINKKETASKLRAVSFLQVAENVFSIKYALQSCPLH